VTLFILRISTSVRYITGCVYQVDRKLNCSIDLLVYFDFTHKKLITGWFHWSPFHNAKWAGYSSTIEKIIFTKSKNRKAFCDSKACLNITSIADSSQFVNLKLQIECKQCKNYISLLLNVN